MTKETITEIIALEKELQARIRAESEKIGHWLAEKEAEIEGELARGLASLAWEEAEAERLLQVRVGEQCQTILAAAAGEFARCRALSQAKLESHARRHLRKILPGGEP